MNETHVNRVSYNGGNGGINERPTAAEEAASRERHVPPVAAQVQHAQTARSNPELRASANHGNPPIAATAKPGEFEGGGAVKAREASDTAARIGRRTLPSQSAVHPNDLPPAERMAAPNTGDAKLDKKYQQQQDKLSAQQNQERQKLQQQQDKEHQQLAKRNARRCQQAAGGAKASAANPAAGPKAHRTTTATSAETAARAFRPIQSAGWGTLPVTVVTPECSRPPTYDVSEAG